METAIKKATRHEHIPPKKKHLDKLVSIANRSPEKTGHIIHALEKRMHEASWMIVFKAFIVIHTLMRGSSNDWLVDYGYHHPKAFSTSRLRDESSNYIQTRNLKIYKGYLRERIKTSVKLKYDPAKLSDARNLYRRSLSPSFFNEIKVFQKYIASILKVKFTHEAAEGAICLCAYRLVVEDLIDSFNALNGGIVNMLGVEHYFTMGRSDAETSLDIYKLFTVQTEETVGYLHNAKILQTSKDFTIPQVKHAPLSLVTALENYLDDLKSETTKPSLRRSHLPDTAHISPDVSLPQPPQPKSYSVDFFASLEGEHALKSIPTKTVVQPTPVANAALTVSVRSSIITDSRNSNNPFRASMISSSSSIAPIHTTHVPARHSAFPAPPVRTTAAKPDPSNSNPFRAALKAQPTNHVSLHNPFATSSLLPSSTWSTNSAKSHFL
ncbi:ANTH domain-containing protein [Dichotomocladium elegans]|nr:ANTH domain-containing protein [Dichotomocladium elegans]